MESRTQRRAAANRLAIVQAAEALLMERGLAAVTPAAVASRADVAVQTLYNRVGGRSALLIAVAERALEENHQYMDVAYASDGDVEQKLRCVAAAYARFARERPHQFRILAEPPDEPEARARCRPDQTAECQVGRIDQPRYRRRLGTHRHRPATCVDGAVGNDEWRDQPDGKLGVRPAKLR